MTTDELKALVAEHDLTPADIAKAAGYSRSSIYWQLRGGSPVSPRTADAVQMLSSAAITGQYVRGDKAQLGHRFAMQNRYMMVKVGVGHHLANAMGYAYEHRVVIEKTWGRRLRAGEVVHHIDGDRSNNDPYNLMLCKDREHHRWAHRETARRKVLGIGLRETIWPDDDSEDIEEEGA